MKKLSAICGLAALMVGAHSAAVNASTVFIATDGDVNFFALPNPPYVSAINLSGSRQVAIFDDTDTSFAANFASATVLNSTNSSSIATFTTAGPSTSVAVTTGDSTSLSGDGRFILGYYNGSNWLAESSVINLNNNIWEVTFTDGSFFQIDATVIPVPAAAWLFGTGLLGLIGVARRKAA